MTTVATGTALNLLLVEDNISDAQLALHELRRAGYDPRWRRVDTEAEFLAALDPGLDIILSDFAMPEFDGMRALARLRESGLDIPFIIVSGTIGEERAVAAIQQGAADYLLKDRLARLPQAVANACQRHRQQQRIRRLSRMRSVLGSINAAIVRIRQRTDLLREACRIAVEEGGLSFARIALADDGDLTLQATAGSCEPGLEARFRTAEAQACDQGQPVIDTAAAPPLAALPLTGADHVLGSILFCAIDGADFDDEEVALLSDLAADVALGLENIEKSDRLHYLANFDTLTALPSRGLLVDRLDQLAGHRDTAIALVLIDIERFRRVNDTLGRHAGDQLLRAVAPRLAALVQDPTLLARVGSACFAVGLTEQRDATAVAHFVERLQAALAEPFTIAGTELRIAVRAGIAMLPGDGRDAETVLRNADAALDRAKRSGERYLFYQPEMNGRAVEALALENRLRQAIAAGGFELHYQPKVLLATGRVVGLEALLRWHDPTNGQVSPSRIVPLLEESGLIIEVGRWVIARAVADHAAWVASGIAVPSVAVNVSARQLREPDFVANLADLAPEGSNAWLRLELTESQLMEDVGMMTTKLGQLRQQGFAISIDDFGTGYSSLAYLAGLPVTELKVDQSFVARMADNPNSMAIVSTIIALAHSLGLGVVAEGIESSEQSHLLRLLRCEEGQGYLFGKAMPASQVAAMMGHG